MRVPRSILLGRPWPAAGEPLWTEADVEAALAWQADLDSQCPGCGHPTDQAWADEHADDYDGRAMRCHACTAAARRSKGIPADDLAGVYVFAEYDPRR